MKGTLIAFAVLLAAAACAQDTTSLPFPDANDSQVDPKIAELVRYRIAKHNHPEGSKTEKRIVAMGTNAVPTLITMAKLAANKDSLVLGKPGVQDYDWELRRPIQMLVQIGDRRAIPLVSALRRYDTKPMRMFTHLARLLCHGTDEQIAEDSKSEDPNVAHVAQRILASPDQYSYYKKKYRKTRESNKSVDPISEPARDARGSRKGSQ